MALSIVDKEVLAAIVALSLVGSLVYIAHTYTPKYSEAFTAIGLLNRDCMIGSYPQLAVNRQSIELCLLIVNYESLPSLFMVVYRIASPDELPSTTAPSTAPVIKKFYFALAPGENETYRVSVPVIAENKQVGEKLALVFELWKYSPKQHKWVYTGKWVHVFLNVIPPP